MCDNGKIGILPLRHLLWQLYLQPLLLIILLVHYYKKYKGDKHDKTYTEFGKISYYQLYKEKTKPDDCLMVRNIVKIFGDGKMAVNHVDINFYKDEIFALLGHNGAGKTTLISMLTGLYEATEGTAYYDGYDILDSNNMDELF